MIWMGWSGCQKIWVRRFVCFVLVQMFCYRSDVLFWVWRSVLGQMMFWRSYDVLEVRWCFGGQMMFWRSDDVLIRVWSRSSENQFPCPDVPEIRVSMFRSSETRVSWSEVLEIKVSVFRCSVRCAYCCCTCSRFLISPEWQSNSFSIFSLSLTNIKKQKIIAS